MGGHSDTCSTVFPCKWQLSQQTAAGFYRVNSWNHVLKQWFSKGGAILPPRGLLAMWYLLWLKVHVSYCRQWTDVRDAAKRPKMHRTAPPPSPQQGILHPQMPTAPALRNHTPEGDVEHRARDRLARMGLQWELQGWMSVPGSGPNVTVHREGQEAIQSSDEDTLFTHLMTEAHPRCSN